MDCPHCKVPLMRTTVCPKCKYDISIPDGGPKHQRWLDEQDPVKLARIEKERLEKENARKKACTSFLATTSNSFSGYKITEYLGIKSGESVLGTGFVSEFSANLNDFFGSESGVMTDKITKAKETALKKLFLNCHDAGANAVIGVDFEMMTLGANMIVTCANGTAVKVIKD